MIRKVFVTLFHDRHRNGMLHEFFAIWANFLYWNGIICQSPTALGLIKALHEPVLAFDGIAVSPNISLFKPPLKSFLVVS